MSAMSFQGVPCRARSLIETTILAVSGSFSSRRRCAPSEWGATGARSSIACGFSPTCGRFANYAVLAALVLSFCAGCRPPPEPGWTVGALHSGVKADRGRLPAERVDAVDLALARNETEGFQILIRADRTNAAAVTVRVSELNREDGGALPADAVSLFREQFHFVLQPTGGYRWQPPDEYPDALLPFVAPDDGEPYGAPFPVTRIGATAKPHVYGRQDEAFAFAEGMYTGDRDASWVVQIVEGGPPGEATFRWSRRWNSGLDDKVRVGRWEKPILPIPSAAADGSIPPVALADGVTIRFTLTPEKNFVPGETYHFRTYAAFNEVVWGDVTVPSNALPGVYTGTVSVLADGALLRTLPISIQVWPFALPRPRTMATAFHGWMDAGFYADNPDADWEFERLMHEHGIDLQMIHGHRTDWAWKADRIDWTSFDAAAQPRLDGSAYPDGVPMQRFHLGMYGPGNEWHWEKAAGQSVERVEAYAAAFAEHLKARGWFDRVYVYCRDEPSPHHVPGIVRDIEAFLRADPDWRGTFMITSAPRPDSPLLPLIDIWCVKYHWWIDPALREQLRNDGRTFWTYTANTPHTPNLTYHIDSRRGYEPRLIKWASWLQQSEGFLYWAAALDQRYPNPWTTAMNDFGANGDANLVYYGARNGPRAPDRGTPNRPIAAALPSFRLKQIRDGLDDWDLFNLAERMAGRDAVGSIVRRAYRAPGGGYGEKVTDRELEKSWTQDARTLEEARRAAAALVIGAMEPSAIPVGPP